MFLFLAVVGFSYAYFTATIVNKDVKDQVVETGTLQLTYTDGPVINIQNMKPGNTINKTITVKNTGSLDAKYDIIWQELTNEITNNEMLIDGTCTSSNGTCESIISAPIFSKNIKEGISIASGVTHTYNLTITFKDTNSSQNYNQGKKFSGVLGIKENKDVTTAPVYCTSSETIVQGTEYINGQYTYRYKQELVRDEDENENTIYVWKNMNIDGWGVGVTDSTSTDPIATTPCTYINDKPVVSAQYMFVASKAATIDLSNFNTSNIINMNSMFMNSKATSIIGLNKFDTSNVIDMSSMFWGSNISTLDLSSFDTSKVSNMSYMFLGAKTTSLDLNNIDTSKVTNMNGMFAQSNLATIKGLNTFNTNKVINMNGMFRLSKVTSLDLSSFDTSNVTDMGGMFSGSNATTINGLEKFDTSEVTNMTDMFSGCQATTLDVSNFNTSKVTDMGGMFNGSNATNITGLNKFDTSEVTYMSHMFQNSNVTNIDLSGFDTSNVARMDSMFYNAKVKTIYVSGKFNTNKLTGSSNMFYGCTNLVGGSGTTYDKANVDKTYARIDGGTSSPGYFTLKQ